MATKTEQAKKDKLILQLTQTVKERKAEIQKVERADWKTNCAFSYNQDGSVAPINLQVISDPRKLVELLAFLLNQEYYFNTAAIHLLVSETFKWKGYTLREWESDIKTRLLKIQIKKKKEELEELEQRLSKLVSVDLREQLELEEIQKLLGQS